MNNTQTASGLNVSDFQQVVDGKDTTLFILKNKTGAELAITNYGAKIVSLMVPDKNGKKIDVVTGHSSIKDYLTSEEPYFGAICGRYGNRIANGCFVLDGVKYDRLPTNNGPNCLHGGIKGFNSVVWSLKEQKEQTLTLSYLSVDGEEGFPGNLEVSITYQLTDDNEVILTYHAVTDKTTVLNLTNHSYFNLSGAGNPTINDHLLTISADTYLPTDETSIPFGKADKVENTPMDFRTQREIGESIDDNFQQLVYGNGYDHTYILNKEANELAFAVRCVSPHSGIVMDTFTTEPGVQLYTGNWMTGNLIGKNGQRYPKRSAVCFETQHFPDSPNKPDYPSTVLKPNEVFKSQTIYKFSIFA